MTLVKANTVVMTRERYTTSETQCVQALREQAPSSSTAIASLQARIDELEKSLAQAQQSIDSKAAEAYERGLKEGQQRASEDFQRSDDKQLALLKNAVQSATTRFDEALDALMPLSIDLAEAALSRVVDDPSRYAELIAQTIDRQLRGLSSQAVLSIDVSAEDFPSQTHIDDCLGDIATRHGLAVVAKAGAAAGTCGLRLTLGRIDADLKAQRQRLAAIFNELRDEG